MIVEKASLQRPLRLMGYLAGVAAIVLIALVAIHLYLLHSVPRDIESVDFWLYKLEHGNDEWRGTAAFVLSKFFGPPKARGEFADEIQGVEARRADIRTALMEALDDPHPVVRSHAVFVLGNVEPSRPLIRKCLNDPSPAVRRSAVFVLRDVESARPLIRDRLDDPSPAVRLNAVFVLGNVESARPLIRECLDDPDPEVRQLARTVLERKFVDESGKNRKAERLPHDPEK